MSKMKIDAIWEGILTGYPRNVAGRRTRITIATPIFCAAVMAMGLFQSGFVVTAVFAIPFTPAWQQTDEQPDALFEKGKSDYSNTCADCHGEAGQGVEGAYSLALVGDDSIGQLTKRISETMPEGSPEDCVGEDAAAVSYFIHQAFYGEAAQIRNRPPRVGVARLTANQLRQSLADLYAVNANGLPWNNDQRGVEAKYFNGDRWAKEEMKVERVDPVIDFDFGHDSPGEGIEAKKFYVHWQGGMQVEVSGRYEIVVRSSCSFTMDFGRDGRRFIDNHVQSGDKTEFKRTIYLTGGRIYPFKINFFQRERKTESPPAKISLSWTPPNSVEEIIPARNLLPGWIPPAFSLQTILPADDRSYGYERGIAVNAQWDDSTTNAALEFADVLIEELWPEFEKKRKQPEDKRQKLAAFLNEVVEKAFRGPLSQEQKEIYIDRQLQATLDDSEAMKRCMLISLKSPYFLYPSAANVNASPNRQAANQLALILFDSLPIEKELEALASGDELKEDDIRSFVWGRMNDYRLKAKMRQFFYQWLNIGQVSEITKSEELYPGFDRPLVADLKASLDWMLDDLMADQQSDFRTLFTTDWAYTTPRLGEFYGETWKPATEAKQSGQQLQKSVSDPEHRFGILTHPYLTSHLSYHDTTSPIHRGVFVIRYLLGRTLRPPSTAFSPLSPDLHPDLTTRQRVALQTSPENCQACHLKINGVGFTLENYDAVGRYRLSEKEKSIDPTGNYEDRLGNTMDFAGPKALADYLVESPDAHRAFVARLFQHFVKQPVAAYGPQTLDELTTKFQQNGFNIRSLLVEIAVVSAMKPGLEIARD